MCTEGVKIRPEEAAIELARLVERQLGYPEGKIDPIALRLFIRVYWSRVSHWAHAIHDEGEPKPASAPEKKADSRFQVGDMVRWRKPGVDTFMIKSIVTAGPDQYAVVEGPVGWTTLRLNELELVCRTKIIDG